MGSQSFAVTEGMQQLIQKTFNCNGTEDHLRNCSFEQRNGTISSCEAIERSAYIVCQGNLAVTFCCSFVMLW